MEKQKVSPSNLMSVADYARFMGVERQTVYNWIKEGVVSQIEFLGKRWVDKSTKK